jgi:glyoxylase-like metal-dependent hydrolase (beta-lactamase superfamily II)
LQNRADMKVEKVLAPNPGIFTGPGTNTYIISSAGQATVLDPGPAIDEHVASIESALRGLELIAVMVTHTHSDHAPAANILGSRFDVDVLGFGPGPEFEPTRTLADGDNIAVGDLMLQAVHTPGHTDDHLCYKIADVIFTGDHIMGGSTVVIEDAVAYMRSLRRIAGLMPISLYPGHGPYIGDASNAITTYIEHRLERERQIVDAVDRGAETINEIVAVVYAELDPALRGAAGQQVEVQLTKLEADGEVVLILRPAAKGQAGPLVRRAVKPAD